MIRPTSHFVAPVFACIFTIGCGQTTTTSGDSGSPSPKDQHASAIQEVLRLDMQYSEHAEGDAERDRVLAMRNLVQNLRSIDLRQCPQEFQDAYLKHCYAWAELIPLVEKYGGFTGGLTAFLEGLAGEYEGDTELARIHKGISDTFLEVERIALRYSVQAKRKRPG